jgi:hypothetical protein
LQPLQLGHLVQDVLAYAQHLCCACFSTISPAAVGAVRRDPRSSRASPSSSSSADRLGYGGLGGKQHARRLGKAALPHHFDKHPEIAQLHAPAFPIP